MRAPRYVVCVQKVRMACGPKWLRVGRHTSPIRIPSSLEFETIMLKVNMLRSCSLRDVEMIKSISGRLPLKKIEILSTSV